MEQKTGGLSQYIPYTHTRRSTLKISSKTNKITNKQTRITETCVSNKLSFYILSTRCMENIQADITCIYIYIVNVNINKNKNIKILSGMVLWPRIMCLYPIIINDLNKLHKNEFHLDFLYDRQLCLCAIPNVCVFHLSFPQYQFTLILAQLSHTFTIPKLELRITNRKNMLVVCLCVHFYYHQETAQKKNTKKQDINLIGRVGQ